MPRYSIVIPTRNGAATLRATLRTVLAVDYDDYEVILCDNDTSDATRQLIDEFGSMRIRYVKAPRPLAMASNWELAVSQAAGDYVTVLGDDDGLLPHAMREWDTLLARTSARVLRWEAAFFVWPDVDLPGQANYFRIPMRREVRQIDSRTQVRQVLAYEACYSSLPMIYNSIVERRLLDDVRRRCGRVFLNRYPDVCSGFVLSHAADRYVSVDVPMTVAGVSRKSTGLGTLFRRSAEGDDWLALNAAERLPGIAWLPDLMIFPTIPVAETFLAVKNAFFPDDDGLALDRERLIAACLSSLRTNSLEEWQLAVGRIRDSLADTPELGAEFESLLQQQPPRIDGPLPLRPCRTGSDDQFVHLDTKSFDVCDVSDAVRLCGQVLARDGGFEYAFTDSAADSAVSISRRQLRELQGQLADKHAAVLSLCDDLQKKDAALQSALDDLQAKDRALHATIRDAQVKEERLQSLNRALGHSRSELEVKSRELLSHTGEIVDRRAALTMERQHVQSLEQKLKLKEQRLQQASERGRRLHSELAAVQSRYEHTARSLSDAVEEKHAALHLALEQARQLQAQLLEKQSALLAALQRYEALRQRNWWRRLRNAA